MWSRLVAVALFVVVAVVVVAGCGETTSRLGGDAPAIGGLPDVAPMGWNSWNTFGCGVTEADVHAQADALVSTGLRDAGYRYVVIDDCWSATTRDGQGRLVADPVTFPSGMAAMGRYLHQRGLKFGIYAGAATQTCAQLLGNRAGSTGSEGHEQIDAHTFADWGVDYLKYDWCATDADHDRQLTAFTAMRDALRSVSRPIVYNINPNSGITDGAVPGATYDWGGVATMTRLSNNVIASWQTGAGPAGQQGIVDEIDAAAPLTDRVQPGAFLDPDALVVGAGNLTPAMGRTQMAMWAMLAAPLIASCDLTTMSPDTLRTLRSAAVIALDQDADVRAGRPVDDNPEIWQRGLRHGVAVSLTNRDSHPRTMAVRLSDLDLPESTTFTDAWSGRAVPTTDGWVSVLVAAHDTVLLTAG